MRRTLSLVSVVLLSLTASAQQKDQPVLRAADALKLLTRSVDLAEATAIAVPGLAHAGGPLVEEGRQNLRFLARSSGQQHAGFFYAVMASLRAYVAVSGAFPKPVPLPEISRRQFDELNANLDRLEVHFRGMLDAKEIQLRGSDRDNLRRHSDANTKLAQPEAAKPRVVFLGDSITDGWRLNEYFSDKDYVNRGISGQITGEMLGRMKADVIDLKPASVLILAGTNDLARGVPISTITNNLIMISDLADYHKTKVIFASILPVSDYHQDQDPNYEQTARRPPDQIRALNAWLQKFCQSRGYTYLDYFSSLVDSAGFLRAELADDGLHPNSAGYRVMAPLAQAAIDKTVHVAAPAPAPVKKRRFPF